MLAPPVSVSAVEPAVFAHALEDVEHRERDDREHAHPEFLIVAELAADEQRHGAPFAGAEQAARLGRAA